jgi:hypothetical protein
MPPTWPRIQLFGNGFGQDASTAKVGISPASAARGSAVVPISAAAAMQMEMVLERLATARFECPRFCIGVMASSVFLACGFSRLEGSE